MKMKVLAVLTLAVVCFNSRSVCGGVISGTISDWFEQGPVLQIGDGNNHVSIWWTLRTVNKGWFYGSDWTGDSDVALASGITAIEQLTDASTYFYASGGIGPHNDADSDPNGIGDFIVWQHNSTGHYGVLRIDDIVGSDLLTATLNGTWWFQTDGSGSFVPEPSTLALATLGLLGVGGCRRRRV